MLDSLILGASLAMDAFAVSKCKGLAVKRLKLSHILICGLYFGAFQALMPTIGFFLGKQFEKYINSFDYWIAFALLAIIGKFPIDYPAKGWAKDYFRFAYRIVCAYRKAFA